MSDRVQLLGVPIDPLRQKDAVVRICSLLKSDRSHHVMTPNNEMLVESVSNDKFYSVLTHTSLSIPDSSGLLFAARLTGQHIPERVTGVDTVIRLCEQLDADAPIFLLGAGSGIAASAAFALEKKNKSLVIAGAYGGSPDEADAEKIITMINQSEAKLLLVAYGAPRQDLWIYKHLSKMPSVRVAIGVGGTFDFLAGSVKRAPAMMRSLYLEWLWRLLLQPSRYSRIMKAVVVFPYLILRYGKKRPRA